MCDKSLRQFRTITGPARREAIRKYLSGVRGLKWTKSPYELSHDERSALDEMARAVSWRKSIASPLSLSAAFYVYLSRDVPKGAQA